MINFNLDPASRIRTATFTGDVGDGMLLEAYASLLKSPDYDPAAHDLVDLRQVTRIDISREALARIISMYTPVDQLGLNTRLAIVAASDVTYGMSRMYELLRGDDVPEEVRVFRSFEEAKKWLTYRL